MDNKSYKIKDVVTGEIKTWTIDQILHEINRDHSSEWQDYNEDDWLEGWEEWVEGEFYTLIK